jgi:hypothetical protein
MSKSANLKAHIQRWGLWATARYLLLRVASDIFAIHIFVARVKRTPEELSNPCRLPEIAFRQIESNELEQLAGDAKLLLDRDFVEAALARGDIAFGAYDGTRLVAYVWRTTSVAPHTDDVWVRATAPYGYSYKSFARPEYRGQRIVPGLILYSDHAMLDMGYTHRVGLIALSNLASLAMGASTGSQNIGRLGFLHWFGKPFFFRSRAVADIDFELFNPDEER